MHACEQVCASPPHPYAVPLLTQAPDSATCRQEFCDCVLSVVRVVELTLAVHAMANSDARPEDACLPALDGTFDGQFDALPRDTPHPGHFLPTQYLTCKGGERLYVGVLPPSVVGGRRRSGVARCETLCILMLPDGEVDVMPGKKQGYIHQVPCRMYWMSADLSLRRVRLHRLLH